MTGGTAATDPSRAVRASLAARESPWRAAASMACCTSKERRPILNCWPSSRQTGGWSSKDVLPIFRELECSDQSGPPEDGPVDVRQKRSASPTRHRCLHPGSGVSGYPFNEDSTGAAGRYWLRAIVAKKRTAVQRRRCIPETLVEPEEGTLFMNSTVERVEYRERSATGWSSTREGTRCRDPP